MSSSMEQSQNILSDKVSRALQVRTDTPALKAALDALTHLDHDDYAVDSRSVRVAIEKDALQQALLLQKELEAIVETTRDLRLGVAETAKIARQVRDATYAPVVTAETENTMIASGNTAAAASIEKQDTTTPAAEDAFGREQRLAQQLSEAFQKRNTARQRLEAVHTFLNKFDLSAEDSRLLDHYAFEDALEHNPINGIAFLKAIERVRKIREALTLTFGSTAELTMPSEDQKGLGTSSALRMMETLAQKQERAYEKLYHWLQKYLNLFPNNNNETNDPKESLDDGLSQTFVRQALYTLRHVPAFYSHTLELIANARRGESTRRFLLALTSGYDGQPPLEMKAHDSVAYVGDMLALAFRSFSIEADVAKGIVQYHPEDAPDDDSSALPSQTEFSVETPMTAPAMVAMSMSGLARPLKSRILQVVATLARRDAEGSALDDEEEDDFEEEGVVARTRLAHLYDICGLLLFYISAFEKGITKLETASKQREEEEEKNPILSNLEDCLKEATQSYEASIRVYGAMLDHVANMTGDSQANLAHMMLAMIFDVRKQSPGFAKDIHCPKESEKILSVEWVTETLVGAALKTCRVLDDALALKRAINMSKSAGMDGIAAEKLNEDIDEKEKSIVRDIVEKETEKVLDLCGLQSLSNAWNRWKEDSRNDAVLMATYPGLSQEEAEVSMKEFYASLYSPPIPSLETIVKDPAIRKTARSKIADNVCAVYQDLYASMISSGQGGYDDTGFLSHTPEQVRTLFSV